MEGVVVFVGGTVASQAIMAASDVTCQVMQWRMRVDTHRCSGPDRHAPHQQAEEVQPFHFDCARHVRFNGVTLVSGFAFQGWWYFLAYAVPGTALRPVMLKTFYTQLFDTAIIPVELAALAVLTPGVTVRDKLAKELLPLQAAAWVILPAWHIVQFLYVPLAWQIAFSRLNGYIMGVTLSYLSFRKHQRYAAIEELAEELHRLGGREEDEGDEEEEEAPPPPPPSRASCDCQCLLM